MELSTTTSLALVDGRSAFASIQLPVTTGIYGRSITVKDAYGAAEKSTISVLAQGSDFFEDGGQGEDINVNYGFRTYVAGSNKWYVTNSSELQPSSIALYDTIQLSNLTVSTINTTTSPITITGDIRSFNTISAVKLVASSNLYTMSSLSFMDQATGDLGSLVASNASLYFNGSQVGGFSSLSSIGIGSNARANSQSPYSIAIGYNAGYSNQYPESIAIGTDSGVFLQGQYSLAIGRFAGYSNQDAASIAIGDGAGYDSQRRFSIAIGNVAGYSNQDSNAIAIGCNAGYFNQDSNTIAIGNSAGMSNQYRWAVAIGENAGLLDQGDSTVAIGKDAGTYTQENYGVAIGLQAGMSNQSWGAVAIGLQPARESQGSNAIAIGAQAGDSNQGNGSIAIGYLAGFDNQSASSIILNASYAPLQASTPGLFVSPVRYASSLTFAPMSYDLVTSEIAYSDGLLLSTLTVSSINGAQPGGGGGGISDSQLASTVEGLGTQGYFSTSGNDTLTVSTLVFHDNPNIGDEETPAYACQTMLGSNFVSGFSTMRFNVSSFGFFVPSRRVFLADDTDGITSIEVQASTVVFLGDSNIQFDSQENIKFQANSNVFFQTYSAAEQPQVWMSSLNVSSINQEPVYHTQIGRIALNGTTPLTTTFSTPFANADYSLTFGALNLGFSSIFATSLASNSFDLNYDINDTGVVMFNATGLR